MTMQPEQLETTSFGSLTFIVTISLAIADGIRMRRAPRIAYGGRSPYSQTCTTTTLNLDLFRSPYR
jgi:hypothetical protein